MTMGVERAFCSVAEAARILDVSPVTIWRWIEAEKLKAYRVGPRNIRIKKDDLNAMIQPARVKPAMEKEKVPTESPTEDELARRGALVARILVNRKQRVIAPLTAADLVRLARAEETEAYE